MASENLTHAEIAARLGVSPAAARALTWRLRLPRLRSDDSNKTLVAIDFAEIQHHPTPRRQPPDNQADIATLKERITALEAELCAEQQRSGDYRAELCAEQQRSDDYRAELCAEQQRSGDYRKDFEREWIRADRECERADRERERADRLIELHQADIATLKERITALEAELWAEQQRSGDYRTDFERERTRADHERERADHLIELRDQLVVELEALRTLLEEASGPVAERCQPRNQSNSGQGSPMFNLASAAAATGVDRCTILCAINGDRLNAQRDAKGSWEIQPCELFRVFPALPASTTQPDQQRAHDPAPLLRNAAQELVVEMQRRERDQRDRWHDALLGMQRHLSDAEKTTEKRNAAPGFTMDEAPAQHGAEVDKRRRSWWPWGRRRGHAERKASEIDCGGPAPPAGVN